MGRAGRGPAEKSLAVVKKQCPGYQSLCKAPEVSSGDALARSLERSLPLAGEQSRQPTQGKPSPSALGVKFHRSLICDYIIKPASPPPARAEPRRAPQSARLARGGAHAVSGFPPLEGAAAAAAPLGRSTVCKF